MLYAVIKNNSLAKMCITLLMHMCVKVHFGGTHTILTLGSGCDGEVVEDSCRYQDVQKLRRLHVISSAVTFYLTMQEIPYGFI